MRIFLGNLLVKIQFIRKARHVRYSRIEAEALDLFGISKKRLYTKGLRGRANVIRNVLIHIVYKEYGYGDQEDVAEIFGVDRATVSYAVKCVREMVFGGIKDPQYVQFYKELMAVLEEKKLLRKMLIVK